jgi:hypothetical protein
VAPNPLSRNASDAQRAGMVAAATAFVDDPRSKERRTRIAQRSRLSMEARPGFSMADLRAFNEDVRASIAAQYGSSAHSTPPPVHQRHVAPRRRGAGCPAGARRRATRAGPASSDGDSSEPEPGESARRSADDHVVRPIPLEMVA